MRLYGIEKDDAAYILDTFPIVREQDMRAFGRYRTKDLVLAYMDLIAAGDLQSQATEAKLPSPIGAQPLGITNEKGRTKPRKSIAKS